MNTRSLKIGLGILLVIAGIAVLQSPPMTNALLELAAAGVVPGTNVVLSPNITLGLLGACLAAAGILFFRKRFVRAVRVLVRFSPAKQQAVKFQEAKRQEDPEVPPAVPESQPNPVVMILVPDKPPFIVRSGKTIFAGFRRYSHAFLLQLVVWI